MPSMHAHPSARAAFRHGRDPPRVRRLPQMWPSSSLLRSVLEPSASYPNRGPDASVVTVTLSAPSVEACGMQEIWRASRAKARIWLRRIKTRRQQHALDVRRLEDIGLTERECRREGAKWFWRV